MELEIHIDKQNICKVIQGEARRVFYSTPEAIGLALLKINPAEHHAQVDWVDFLATHFVAFAAQENKSLTLFFMPSQQRTITHGRDGASQEYVTTFPHLLFGVRMTAGVMTKTSVWVIQPNMERKLSLASRDLVLCAFPYGNVYDHGGVCWGTTQTQDIRHPQDVVEFFFRSAFNGDLFHASTGQARTLPAMITQSKGILPLPPQYDHTVLSVATGLVE